MCGIAGIFTYREASPPVDGAELLRIREAMAWRGPDGAGQWLSPGRRVGLAHRRLAIIDLSEAGAQPMATADGRLTITYNGEIYNYRELRRELEGKGYVFRTQSDTEVLLHLYADRGADMVHALRGMFAFGIWDERNQELILARDPLGIKPLYYADCNGTFRFATLVEALMQGGGVDCGEDIAGIAGFYLMGYVPEPYTVYREVRALPAGCTMRVGRDGARRPRRYFSITEEFLKAESNPSRLTPDEAREQLNAALRDSMRHHMVADVPVGIFLSAGVDSSVLASLGAEFSPGKLHAITLGFREYRGTLDDETWIAERTAARLRVQHSSEWINRSDFRFERNNFFAAMDQPSTDGVNSFLVSKTAAASRLKVAISGLGGDELFGGYPSFRDVPRMQRWIPHAPMLGRAMRVVSDPLLRRLTSPKYAGLLEYGSSHAGAYLLRRALHMPWELPRLLGRKRAADALSELRPLERLDESIRGLKNERCIVAALELSWYMRNQLLRDSDWAGMFHGVEIRVPFVDVQIIRILAPFIASARPPAKSDLANAVAEPLPAEIVVRRKTGFSVPVRDWLRADRPGDPQERGLRGWSQLVARVKRARRFLALLTDGFGGHGGIALYNRDLLTALCSFPRCAGVVAIPRLMPNPPEPMPAKLTYLTAAVGSKMRYLAAVLRILREDREYDMVVCGHINLLPLAWLASRILRVPLVLFIYGIDAWHPGRNAFTNLLARKARWIVSISATTARKFRDWASPGAEQPRVLPNAIHTEWYGPGAKNPELIRRYALQGRTVLMTLGRLVSAERYKGFDEVLELMPELIKASPGLVYMVVGDGSDQARLEEKARALGLADRVVFTGRIAETEKADHYRLADAYVMASRGEGFGFVLLEAMACGVPVIASERDGGREAVRDGELGILINPVDREELKCAILDALARPKGVVPAGLEYFSFGNFETRAHSLFAGVLAETASPIGGA
jgi:asparagine synthase (glutamine-hydrolysing)